MTLVLRRVYAIDHGKITELMPRRKTTPPPEDAIQGIPELDDDEQFVKETTTKQTVRKERVPTQAAKPEPEIIDVDDDPDDDQDDEPHFSETSLAALQFGHDEDMAAEYCNVLVRRNPDSMTDKFVTPNSSLLNMPPLRNVSLGEDRSDIEERVREHFGGGHYFFQIQYRGQIGKSWKASLSDLPASQRQATTAADPYAKPDAPQPMPESPPPAVNPFDQFFETLKKQKEMKDLLFGDEMKELDRLRREAAERASQPPGYRQSETLQILEQALKADNPALSEKLLKMAFPEESESGGGHWIADILRLGFEHKEDLAGIVQMVFGGLAPQPQAGGIEAMLRQQPPAALASGTPAAEPEPPRSNFQRKFIQKPETEPDETDTDGGNTDADTNSNE